MIRNRKYLGRRVLAVLLAASVVCSSVLPAAAEELVSPDVAEESGMLVDAAEDDTSSGADDAIMDEDVPENGIADTEETESGWEEADGLILQMEEVEDPELVEEAPMAAASHMITKAEELPTNIESGETYVLAADITLAANQQIETLAGTLDGQGHTITLVGDALAKEVSGTIQNLGVAGTVTVTSGYKGSIAETLTGTIQNSYSTAQLDAGWNTVGGMVGILDGGLVRNCYYAGELEMMNGGIAANAVSTTAKPQVSNCYFQSGTMIETIALNSGNADVSNCAAKSADELKTEATVVLLNTSIQSTGYVFAVAADGGFPVLVKGNAGGTVQITWEGLESALEKAAALEEMQQEYTEDTWKTLSDAVAAGKELLEKKEAEEVAQDAINAAAKAITDAITGLKRQPTVAPVAIPENAIQISS